MKWNDILGPSAAPVLRIAPQKPPLSSEQERNPNLERLYIKKKMLEEQLASIEKEAAYNRRVFLLQLDPLTSQKN